MTHADLVSLLEALALEAGAASFWHGQRANQDINYEAEFPQAHLYLTPSQLAGKHITTQVGMCFIGADAPDASEAQSLLIQADMDLLTQRFYTLLLEVDNAELVGAIIERVPTVREGLAVGTGYFVTFSLQHLAQC